MVAVTAMGAVSFGGRATAPFVGDNAGPAWDNALTTAVVLLIVGVNLVDAKFVARA